MQHIIQTKSIYKSECIKIKKDLLSVWFARKEKEGKRKRGNERGRERVSLSLSLFWIFEIYISGSGEILGDALCVFKCIPFCHSSVTFVHIIIIINSSSFLCCWWCEYCLHWYYFWLLSLFWSRKGSRGTEYWFISEYKHVSLFSLLLLLLLLLLSSYFRIFAYGSKKTFVRQIIASILNTNITQVAAIIPPVLFFDNVTNIGEIL